MKAPRSSNIPWTDAELADAVDAYVFLLRVQAVGLRFPAEAGANALLEEALPGRNDASLRYRFRNISAVVQEMGGPLLNGYSPAEQVGAGVRPRIRTLLLANPEFRKLIGKTRATSSPGAAPAASREAALEALAKVRRSLDEIEREVLGIGHNNPPEPIHADGERREVFDEARKDIAALESEMKKPAPDQAVVAAHSVGLAKVGVKLSAWVGQRTTKFADVALAALAPALVLKVTGLLPALVDAIGAVARAVGH